MERNTTDQPYTFSTKRYDEKTGLNYYGFRYYNPAIGRWLTRDPLGEIGGFNLYEFTQNSPINWIDIFGLKTWIFISGGGGRGVLGPIAGSAGIQYLIDPKSGKVYLFWTAGIGPGFGSGWEVHAEGGVFDGPCDPEDIGKISINMAFFSTTGKGISGQLFGTSEGGEGGSLGYASGAGHGLSVLVTYTEFIGSGTLPKKYDKVYKKILRTITGAN